MHSGEVIELTQVFVITYKNCLFVWGFFYLMSFSEQPTLTVRYKELLSRCGSAPTDSPETFPLCLTGNWAFWEMIPEPFAKLDKFLSKISLVPHQLWLASHGPHTCKHWLLGTVSQSSHQTQGSVYSRSKLYKALWRLCRFVSTLPARVPMAGPGTSKNVRKVELKTRLQNSKQADEKIPNSFVPTGQISLHQPILGKGNSNFPRNLTQEVVLGFFCPILQQDNTKVWEWRSLEYPYFPQNDNSGHTAWDASQFHQLSLVSCVSSGMNLLCV